MSKKEHQVINDPTVAYGVDGIQKLRTMLVDAVNATNDTNLLKKCIALFAQEKQPCSFSDEEFKIEILESEESGVANKNDVTEFFAKWH